MADEHFYISIDMHELEVKNHRLHLLSSDPSSPPEGLMWYNSTDKVARIRDNSVTNNLWAPDDDFINLGVETSIVDADSLLFYKSIPGEYKRITKANLLTGLGAVNNAYYRLIAQTGTQNLDASGEDDIQIYGDGVVIETLGSNVGQQKIELSFKDQNANKIFAGPSSGGAATPAFRDLVAADIPNTNRTIDHTTIDIIASVAIGGGGTIDADVTLNLDISELVERTPASGDWMVFNDISEAAGTHSKATVANFVAASSYWTRVTGTPNYLHPAIPADEIHADIFNEYTADAGVKIETVLLKDGHIYIDTDVTISHQDRGIYWGDATDGFNTGFHETSDNIVKFMSNNQDWIVFTSNIYANDENNRLKLRFGSTPSTTNPVIHPVGADTDTGIGQGAADQLSLIAGAKEVINVTETGNEGYVGVNTSTINIGEYGSLFTVTSQFSNVAVITSYRQGNNVGWGTGFQSVLQNSDTNPVTYSYFNGYIITNTAGTEDGGLSLYTMVGGTLTERMDITNTEITAHGDVDINSGYLNFITDDVDIRFGDSKRFWYNETYNSVHIGLNAAPSATVPTNAIGQYALFSLTTSPNNFAIGVTALYSQDDNVTGGNMAIGNYAFTASNTLYNLGIGNNAGRYTTGGTNVAIGTSAGQGVSGTST